ncbi:unnamed protein product [Adineta ricciae]|uniref:Peptidase S1 domain-containing protein n=1 Tax=Adineta ricciae TaxID=249248 RepID=A0A813WEV0_ADIRI|nr:unnamed protein product [Adineta ricciae]
MTVSYVWSQALYTCSANSSCGCSTNSAILARIVGGESATDQTWGWMTSLRYSSTNSHFCGGSIISKDHILTAAHCVVSLSSPSSIRAYVGSVNLYSGGQTCSISNIFIHPNYSTSTFVNDIAILKLSSSLDLTQNALDKICLPNVSVAILTSQEYPVPNTSLVAIGWGYLSEGSGSVSPTLQQVTIQAVADNSTYCKRLSITDAYTQFCAGVMPLGGKDTCQGDSGGPLMMFTTANVWQIVGITSNGIGCAEKNLPGVYTRVAAFQTWINDTMNNTNRIYSFSNTIFTLALAFFLLLTF